MKTSIFSNVAVAVLACTLGPLHSVQAADGKLIACQTPGWAQWRGPRRDGISDEKDLLQAWPEGGPKLLWTAEGIGSGYSSPIVAAGSVFLAGDVGNGLRVFAVSLDGTVRWQARNGARWVKPFPGSRAACCYDDGRVYHMNAHGRLACLRADDGKEVWAVEVLKQYRARNIVWGISECVLVDGPRVIVTPAGSKALMAALDKKTGKPIWACPPLDQEMADYSSPILAELDGKRQIITCGLRHAFGVEAETGTLLWKFRHHIPSAMVSTTPGFLGDSITVSNCSRREYAFYRVRIDTAGGGGEKVWSSPIRTTHEAVLCVGGRVYGSSEAKPKGYICFDAKTGKQLHVEPSLAGSASIHADGRIYCLTSRGIVALLKPTEAGFEIVGRFQLPGGRKNVWAYPAVCDGRLYLRNEDKLYCYDIRR